MQTCEKCYRLLNREGWCTKCDEQRHSIYEAMLRAGVEIDHHMSDLYVPATTTTLAILDCYPTHKANVERFWNQASGSLWLDIPFAYAPFWDRVALFGGAK